MEGFFHRPWHEPDILLKRKEEKPVRVWRQLNTDKGERRCKKGFFGHRISRRLDGDGGLRQVIGVSECRFSVEVTGRGKCIPAGNALLCHWIGV